MFCALPMHVLITGILMFDMCRYLGGASEFFTNFMVVVPFMHYLVLQLFRAVVTLPLNQNEAAKLPSAVPGVCDGQLKNIYVQAFFSQLFYLVGSVLYVRCPPLVAPALCDAIRACGAAICVLWRCLRLMTIFSTSTHYLEWYLAGLRPCSTLMVYPSGSAPLR